MPNESFLELVSKLKEACDNQDWEKIKIIDQQINADIRLAIQRASSKQDKASLSSHLKSIQKIYSLVIDQGVNYRDEVSKELRKLNQDKKAVNLYLDSSRYLG